MKHAVTRTLFDYWTRLRGQRTAPDRFEIEPGDIRHILGDTFILEAIDRQTFNFRLAGTRLCSAYCRELKGRNLLDLWAGKDRDALACLLAAIVEDGVVTRLAVEAPMKFEVSSAEAILAVVGQEEPCLLSVEASSQDVPVEAFVEPLVARPALLIAGGGHVGQAVARQADLVGFEIVVIDDRPEFTRADLFPPGVTTRCGPVDEQLARLPIDGDTYVVIVTRGHRHDAEALAACLHRPAAYVGMIGSRRKVAMLREEFIASARATAAELDRVYAPIGLEIGARTVPEIATSIVAQLIAVRRGTAAARCCIR